MVWPRRSFVSFGQQICRRWHDAIRSLFSTRRPIDRPIEKVIDYYADDPARLRAEVEEYEVTPSVERNLRRFLDVFGEGVRAGHVTETGICVSGFYGSGKSSFTKYLGFALDSKRTVGDRPFLDLFVDPIDDLTVRQQLKSLAVQEPTAVVMLDLGSEQLAASSSVEVSRILYWKVLQWAGYSREEKLAQLELHLVRDGLYAEFQRAYAEQASGAWTSVRNASHVMRHETLLAKVWDREYVDEVDYLRVYIRRLRSKLEADPERPRYLLTERRLGFRFRPEP